MLRNPRDILIYPLQWVERAWRHNEIKTSKWSG